MKAANLFFVLFAGTIGGGCGVAASVNPLYSPNAAKTRDELVGTWVKHEDPHWKISTNERLEITKTGDKAVYGVKVVTDGDVTKTTFHLVELGDSLYADALTTPGTPENRPPVHLFFLVKKKGDYIGISAVDAAKLKIRLKTDPIPHETYDGGVVMLTAKTDELQRFFRDAGQELFSFDDNHTVFHRVKSESTKSD